MESEFHRSVIGISCRCNSNSIGMKFRLDLARGVIF